MKSQLKSGLIIIFAVILASCSSTKKLATPDPNKTLPAPADKALLYVLRPSSLGFAINFKVSVDDEFLGMTKGRNYIFTYLEPGKHTILSKAESK